MMKLESFLARDRILLGLSADDQKMILEQLVSPLLKDGIITDSEELIRELQVREAEITTVMENGVAIPHARSSVVKKLGLVVGITDGEGIQFSEDTDATCRLFFCIAVPTFAPMSHLPLLRLLAKFASDPQRVEKLVKCKNSNGVSRCLTTFKG